jgi:hypothetical protein
VTWALSTPATCWHSEATNHSKCVLFRLPSCLPFVWVNGLSHRLLRRTGRGTHEHVCV